MNATDRSRLPRWQPALLNIARGFLMGGADIIPGVSGGTIALILGIYERLVGAISRVDLEWIGLLKQRRWRDAAVHVDLAFLAALAAGIGAGIVLLAGLMHYLLTDPVARPRTLAAFFGLILASGLLVARLVRHWNPRQITLLVAAAVGAWWLTGLTGHAIEPSLPYVFLCGMIAICAMILPGISGAFILVLLGAYVHVTGAIKGIPRGQLTGDNVATVTVFLAGCLIGLIAFSKLLKYLLARHEPPTMAVLCGFIFGSLRKVWPFQRDLTPAAEFKDKVYENYWPEQMNASVAVCIAIVIVAAIAVFALEWFAHKYDLLESEDPFEPETPNHEA